MIRHLGVPTLGVPASAVPPTPYAEGHRLRAVLILIIPADPDEPTVANGFGPSQVRGLGHTFRWLLLGDSWMNPGTVRAAR